MSVEFLLPDVGEGIDAGEIVAWHVAVGDVVVEDQEFVDVQTDKAIVAIPCPVAGTVLQLGAEEGDTVHVGALLALFGDPSEQAPTRNGADSLPASVEAGAPATTLSPSAADAADVAAPTAQLTSADPAKAELDRPLAAPAVRRLARERGVELSTLRGSGPHGRILREDLDGHAAQGQGAPATAIPAASRASETIPLRGIRRVIARNMTEAWQTIPHILDFREVDASSLLAGRKALRADAEREGDAEAAAAITPFPMLAKIAISALSRHPALNSSVDMEREEITRHHAVHMSIAVATPDGLLTPVVADADTKSVRELAVEIVALAQAARARKLRPEQLRGGTFTVNNYGAIGSPLATPIIPPGQSANLGFGRIQQRAVVRDEQVVVRPVLGLSCAADHRILDGDALAAFVSDVVAAIEEPVLLLGRLR